MVECLLLRCAITFSRARGQIIAREFHVDIPPTPVAVAIQWSIGNSVLVAEFFGDPGKGISQCGTTWRCYKARATLLRKAL